MPQPTALAVGILWSHDFGSHQSESTEMDIHPITLNVHDALVDPARDKATGPMSRVIVDEIQVGPRLSAWVTPLGRGQDNERVVPCVGAQVDIDLVRSGTPQGRLRIISVRHHRMTVVSWFERCVSLVQLP